MTLKNNTAVESHLAEFRISHLTRRKYYSSIKIIFSKSEEIFPNISRRNSTAQPSEKLLPHQTDIYFMRLSNAFRTTISKRRRMKTENYFLLISTCEIGRFLTPRRRDFWSETLCCVRENLAECFCLHFAFVLREKSG